MSKHSCPFLQFHQVQILDWHPGILLSARYEMTNLPMPCAHSQLCDRLRSIWPAASAAAVNEGLAFIGLCLEEGHSFERCLDLWDNYLRAIKRAVASHPSSQSFGHATAAAFFIYGDVSIDYKNVARHVALAQVCHKQKNKI